MPTSVEQTARLQESIAAVCPIVGVRMLDPVAHVVEIQYDPSATGPQQAAAQSTLAAFDWSQSAHDTWLFRSKTKVVGATFVVRKAADESTSSASFVDVSGLSFDLSPNSHYAFEFVGAYSAAATTTGLQLAVNGPSSPVFMRGLGQISASATAVQNGAFGAYDTAIAGTASAGSTPLPFIVKGTISTNAVGGTFTLRMRSEVGGSAVTVLRGSYGLLFGATT